MLFFVVYSQYVYVVGIENSQDEPPFCVKPHFIKDILANVQESSSMSKKLLKLINKIKDGDTM